MADIKQLASELVEKIKSDPQLLKKFTDDPVATLKSMTGIDLPEDKLEVVASAVKAKLGADDIASLAGKLGKLF